MSSRDPHAEVAAAIRGMREMSRRVPPRQRFEYWVRLGVQDRTGARTRAFGGDAEPEPDSLAALGPLVVQPRDRLVWVLRHTNVLVLDGQTARMICGTTEIDRLVAEIREAEAAGLIERWTDQGGEPATLDAEKHRYHAVGVKLTTAGRQWADGLVERIDPERPVENLTL